ncbi:hypothetical protein GCM10017786_13400 [Amycolatopsis deserti]|uniref:Uncharacterized protein n=1 Tax=Amycolatopsis deserti TaxID=185696 RepID=A0ABQ3IJA4_9PSEU|nr:hypothetical protein GCM10017786_13400 [Amycolatopsis deserti]
MDGRPQLGGSGSVRTLRIAALVVAAIAACAAWKTNETQANQLARLEESQRRKPPIADPLQPGGAVCPAPRPRFFRLAQRHCFLLMKWCFLRDMLPRSDRVGVGRSRW